MKPRLALLVLAAVVAFAVFRGNAYAAPALQLPWPAGIQYRINGGNTYGCDTHSNPAVNYYAIDFQFSVIGDQVTAPP